jgi:hypothetical protein
MRDYEELKGKTNLKPDLYKYWFKFITIYPSDTYVCSNSLIDLGESWKLIDVGFYHPDKCKSIAYYLIIPKTMVTQLSQPPSLR